MRHYVFPCEYDTLARVLDFITGRGEVLDLQFIERGRYYRVVARFDPDFEEVLYGIMKERVDKMGISSIDVSDYWREHFYGELPY